MNIAETTQALALAQAFDNRTVGEVNIRAWYAVLGDADAADVMAAIKDHYATTTEWIMPAHIRKAVAARVKTREVSPWAPGQYGVPLADAMPEISGPVDESTISPSVMALLAATRAMLPEGSREALMPRRVEWEREYAAHVRVKDGTPNPLYRADAAPALVACPICPAMSQDLSAHMADYHPDVRAQALADSDGFCAGGPDCNHSRHPDA